MTLPQPGHLLSLAEWDSLPDDPSQRFELSEGVLVVVPSPIGEHSRVARRLANQLDDQLPHSWTAVQESDLVLNAGYRPTVRKPDVLVVPWDLRREPRYQPADVLLAVEILSPSTRETDEVIKFGEYADAQIPNYWLVDIDSPFSLTAYTLVDGDYELVARGSGKLNLFSPAEVHIDVEDLGRR